MSGKEVDIQTFSLGNNKVLWFPGFNKYIIAQPDTDEIIKLIWENPEDNSIIDVCRKTWDIEEDQANRIKNDFIEYIEQNIKINHLTQAEEEIEEQAFFSEINTISEMYYKIFEQIFFVEYESEKAQTLNHPKLAHLEISPTEVFHHHFKVFHSGDSFTLNVDGNTAGSWKESENHFLTGKFSMEILQKIYNRKEKDWLGVFHAAGISNGKESIMFFGDSGNGKSTLSALLMANGFDVLSDDFLPVTSNPELVCRFPAALSIKKTAYTLVSSAYADLEDAEEHHSPLQDKTFRYLPPLKTQKAAMPCKAIIYVKYQEGIGLTLEKMPREETFQLLVPDSWISPEPENARRFVHWFNQLPCYRLTYSDNPKMVETIKKLFNNELS